MSQINDDPYAIRKCNLHPKNMSKFYFYFYLLVLINHIQINILYILNSYSRSLLRTM